MAGGPSSSPLLHRTVEALTNSRVKEERESAMSRLLDPKFNIKTYVDPLVPRDKSKAYPLGVTSDMEHKWLAMIEQSRQ